jgi:hypothetical protein
VANALLAVHDPLAVAAAAHHHSASALPSA